MFIPLDPSSGIPIYRQIKDQVRRMIASGTFKPGDRLPSVRENAAALQINPLTVAKAYGELEHEGVLEMRRGLGMFVAFSVGHAPGVLRQRRQAAQTAAARFVLEARQAGLSADEASRLVMDSWTDAERKHLRGAKHG